MKASATIHSFIRGSFAQADEDFGGVAFGFDGVPDFLDFAVGADQKTAADDSLEQAAHEFLAAPRAVGLDHLVRRVAEQREIQFVFVAEVLQGLHRVGAGSENGDTELVELLFCVTKLGRFDRSTGSIRSREKEEQDAATLEVFERELFAAVGGEGEFGGFVADFEHELVLLNLWTNMIGRYTFCVERPASDPSFCSGQEAAATKAKTAGGGLCR